MHEVITNRLALWTSAVLNKSNGGRASNGKSEAYGIRRLRELILELAVRGRLVPQDPNDEPASVLVKKIAAQKEQMIKNGKIRRPRSALDIAVVELPFQVPKGWVWESLGNLATQITDGTHHTPNYIERGVPFISVKDLDGRKVSFDDCRYISQEQHEQINSRCNPEYGDLLICRIGTLGRATIVNTKKPFSLFVSVGLLKFLQDHFIPQYAHIVLHSPALLDQYEEIKAEGSHTNKLNLEDLPKLLIPIPPLPEQHRIVAKVDELMALCDQLEREQTHSMAAHQTLVETLIGTLTRVQSQQELTEAWARIATHFDVLFTTERSVDQLKETILQLAVTGRLVLQNPNDEDVKVLLTKNDQRRGEVAETDRRAEAAQQSILSADDGWEIPETWNWRGLADLVLFVDYRGNTPEKQSNGIRLLTAKNVRRGRIDLSPEEFLSEEEYTRWMVRGFPKIGDVLFTTEAPMGNAAVVDLNEHFALAQRVICFQGYGALEPRFLVLQILSSQFQFILEKNGTGMTAKGIKGSKLKQLPVAIPPLAEQHRIVSKVDELMSLCETLKARISDAQTTQVDLADAIVEQVVD